MPSDYTPIFFVIIFFVFMYYIFSPQEPTRNEGSLVKSSLNVQNSTKNSTKNNNNEALVDATVTRSRRDNTDTVDDSAYTDASSVVDLSISKGMNREDDSVDSSIENIKERAMGMNNLFFRRKDGAKYRKNTYRNLDSGTLKNVDGYDGVQDVTKSYTDRYVPIDETDGIGAPIDIGSRKDNEKEKYDVNAFLPQEEEKDWFETIETTDVKNSNLINIYRPIGSNTIGSSQKAASYDIRGYDGAICPKFVNGPWLQSSYEPDRSTKSLC